jgi:RNA polymerase sigma factor (sigma-70 family)
MKMFHGIQTVTDIQTVAVTEAGWSEGEDPEHQSFEEFFNASGDDEDEDMESVIAFKIHEVAELEQAALDELLQQHSDESLHVTEFDEDVADEKFWADLKWSCHWVFQRFTQSTHSSCEDLQQEVLIRFWRWLPRYRNEANRKTVFVKIATNVLIDARRSERSNRRRHERVELDELEAEPVKREPNPEIEDRIFWQECRDTLSKRELVVFDEHFIVGESLRKLAGKYGVSTAAMAKTKKRVIRKVHARQCA